MSKVIAFLLTIVSILVNAQDSTLQLKVNLTRAIVGELQITNEHRIGKNLRMEYGLGVIYPVPYMQVLSSFGVQPFLSFNGISFHNELKLIRRPEKTFNFLFSYAHIVTHNKGWVKGGGSRGTTYKEIIFLYRNRYTFGILNEKSHSRSGLVTSFGGGCHFYNENSKVLGTTVGYYNNEVRNLGEYRKGFRVAPFVSIGLKLMMRAGMKNDSTTYSDSTYRVATSLTSILNNSLLFFFERKQAGLTPTLSFGVFRNSRLNREQFFKMSSISDAYNDKGSLSGFGGFSGFLLEPGIRHYLNRTYVTATFLYRNSYADPDNWFHSQSYHDFSSSFFKKVDIGTKIYLGYEVGFTDHFLIDFYGSMGFVFQSTAGSVIKKNMNERSPDYLEETLVTNPYLSNGNVSYCPIQFGLLAKWSTKAKPR